MTRSATPYAERPVRQVVVHGAVDVSEPVAGFYRHRLRSGSVIGGVRIWFGQPVDPVTQETMDRSWRWQAILDDGSVAEFDDIWPACAGSPITEQQYRDLVARREWAKQNAPDSAYAQPGKRFDPLRSKVLPF